MFHRKYSHGHSAALGFLLALALYQHALLFGVLTFAAGLVAGRAWSFWSDCARAVKMRLLSAQAKRETISTEPVPVYSTRPRSTRKARSTPTDDIPF
jgi:hypothetical protein